MGRSWRARGPRGGRGRAGRPGDADRAAQHEGLAGHAPARRRTASSVRCFRSFGLMASVFSMPCSMRQRQVPQRPPPHLKGMPPFSRMETRRRLELSSAVTVLAAAADEGDGDHGRGGQRRRLQRRVGAAEAGEVTQLAPGILDASRTSAGTSWAPCSPGRRRLVDHAHLRLRGQVGDHEARAAHAAEQVVPGLDRGDARRRPRCGTGRACWSG